MGRPRTIVLIPVYRNQRGLDKTLVSLRSANGDFEVLVVDDGSPCAILIPTEIRPGVRLNLLRTDQNGGITKALNYGLGFIVSRGYEYIARLDAGDTVAKDRFELQGAYLDANRDCAAVSSFIEFFSEEGGVLFRHRAPTDRRELAREMRLRNCLLHSGVTLRTQAILESGPYSENYPAAEDYELFLRLLQRYELAVLPQVLTFSWHDPNGISIRERRRQQASRLRCQLRYFDFSTVYSPLGIVRTLIAMLTPSRLVLNWKRACIR